MPKANNNQERCSECRGTGLNWFEGRLKRCKCLSDKFGNIEGCICVEFDMDGNSTHELDCPIHPKKENRATLPINESTRPKKAKSACCNAEISPKCVNKICTGAEGCLLKPECNACMQHPCLVGELPNPKIDEDKEVLGWEEEFDRLELVDDTDATEP